MSASTLESEFLSPSEIKALTGEAKAGPQAQALERMHVPYRISPNGRPIISRVHVRQWLSGVEVTKPRGPNFDAVR